MGAIEDIKPLPVAELAEHVAQCERSVSKLRLIVETLQREGIPAIDVARVPSLYRGSKGMKAFTESAWKAFTLLVETGPLSVWPAGGQRKTTQDTENKDLRADTTRLSDRPK